MSNQKETMLKIVTAKSQADKAIHSLKGILLGINLDGIINEKEINELLMWVRLHKDLINRNPFNEFMSLIENTIENKIPPKETIEDLYWLCQKYESDNYYYNVVTSDLQTLQGLCQGILSDGIISDVEILELDKWLDNNVHLNSYYPYDEIRSLVHSIVSNHKIDDNEKTILKAYLNQFIKLQDINTITTLNNDISEVTISSLCSSSPNVVFPNKSFCITGILKRGNRETLENDIRKLGGNITDSVSKKTDYLIVGDNGNPAWAFSCYGRKVEKAVGLRKDGHPIVIIHEFDFSDIVDDKLCDIN